MEQTKSFFNSQSIFPSAESLNTSFHPTEWDEEELMIAKTVERFVEEQVMPELSKLESHDYQATKQLFSEVGDLGLLGAEVPEIYGGLNLGKKMSGLIAEKMGASASFSVAFNIHSGVGTLPYVYFGTEKQQEKYLPKLISGEWIGAYALTEPGSGSDALSVSSSATLDTAADEWVLNGEKQWITNANVADVYVVFAKTTEGMAAFIVERTMSGVSIGAEEKKLGIKGSSTATLILEDVRIPQENILGEIGKGHHIALNILNLARLKLAFANVGTAKQSLALAVNYGKERKQFKRAITDFTMIQEKIANMALAVYGAESSTYYTASLLDQLDEQFDNKQDTVKKIADYAMDGAINKVYASEALDMIVDETLQIHGGYGYMDEYKIERLYRDARINRIFEGTNEINRLTIAKSFLKRSAKDLSFVKQSEQTGAQAERSFVQFSEDLLLIIMKALSNLEKETLENEQEYLRLLSDVIQELYVVKTAVLRCEDATKNKEIQQQITDIMSEESYRKIEEAAISIISAVTSDDVKKREALAEIRNLSIPLYTNLFAKKRKLAEAIIENEGYFI